MFITWDDRRLDYDVYIPWYFDSAFVIGVLFSPD